MSDDPRPSAGIGQQGPSNVSSEFNVREFQIEQTIARVSTTKVVKVIAVYDANMNAVDPSDTGVVGPTGFLDVQPLVNQIDGGDQATPHGVIHGVPFTRQQGGAGAVIIDPRVGDIGAMQVADRDISSVKANRDAANPGSTRRYDAADGIYSGPMLNGTPDQYVRFKEKGFVILDNQGNSYETGEDGVVVEDKFGNKYTTGEDGVRVEDLNGNVLEMKAGGTELTTDLFTVNGPMQLNGGMTSTGGAVFDGPITGDDVSLNTHIHPQGNDSHGDTEVDTGPPIPGP